MSDGFKGDDVMPQQVNGDSVLRLEIDLGIDFKNYERIPKVWGEEIVLTRSKYYTCKLLIVKEGYTSSIHKHLVKNETFICIKGQGMISVCEQDHNVLSGDQMEVYAGIMHSFKTKTGMVLMEISTFDDAADNYRETQSGKIGEEHVG